jgi:hypothetical protein
MKPGYAFSVCLASIVASGCSGTPSTDDGGMHFDARSDAAGDAPSTDATEVATGDAPAADAPLVDGGSEPALASAMFTMSTEDFLNPERGWMEGGGVDPASSGSYAGFRADGYALVYANVRLDAYRTTTTLPASFLSALTAGFARVRAAHIKVILRVTYNDPSTYPCTDTSITGECADAPLDTALGHIHQLGTVIRENADVIAVVEAGIVGLWGEWHGSTHMLDTTANQNRILAALLAEVPPSRSVLVRTPMYKANYGFAAPLTDAQGFDGSEQSRIGHHNDCFLASDDDFGTYDSPVSTWLDYIAADARFVPEGGETCAVDPPRSDCASATAEMERLHWSFLNRVYHPDVIAGWGAGSNPCVDDISRRLGYRFVLVDANWSEAVRPGGVLALQFHIRNEGYAALYNRRPLLLVVDDGSTRTAVALASIDPRRWASGAMTAISTRVRVPADAHPGTYSLSLWLPDDEMRLRDVADYSVRFANTGTWRAATGDNLVTESFRIDASAPGAVDTAATTWTEIP